MTYDDWCRARDTAAFSEYGLASLAATVWLDGSAAPAQADASLGDLRVRTFVRDGRAAVRVLDPARASREGMTGIDRFPHDPAWVLHGRAAPAPREPQPTVAVDGHRSSTVFDVAVALTVAGEAVTLLAHRDGDELFAAFTDATAADHEYSFRMVRAAAPGADGEVTVDLNRAYLPPSRFSPHYVCVTPVPANRWSVAVRAGERGIARA